MEITNCDIQSEQQYQYMNELIPIQTKIYEIRDQKVMLDRDLATLYGIETKVLKQSVNRNKKRFPEDFMFQLSEDEFESLRSQFVTSNKRGGTRYMPYAFTEQGVAMLSSILNSDAAIEVNIAIMRVFVAIRQRVIALPATEQRLAQLEQNFEELKQDLEEIFTDYNDINEDTRMQLELINESLAKLQEKKIKPHKRIGFKTSEE